MKNCSKKRDGSKKLFGEVRRPPQGHNGQACDKRLARLISYIHHSCKYRQHCYVGNTAQQCCWDCFKTPILQEILRIQNLHQVQHCAFSEAIRLFQSVGCVRNKFQFSHSSTESEIISLDAGLGMDGFPALDFWDLIVGVLHGNTHQNDQVRGNPYKSPTRTSMLSNCFEMLILGTYLKTWHSVVSKQTCTIDYKMDQSMWQTSESIDFIYSSYKWIQTILSCGKYCQAMQTGTVSRLWFCRRPWRLKINIRRTSVHFRKSHVCANKLDVQETDFSFIQFYTQPTCENKFQHRIPMSTKEESGDVDLSESETGSLHEEEEVTGKPVAYKTANGIPYASSKSDCQGGPKAVKEENWSHNLYISPATVHHMEAVFSIVRNIYGREHDDPMDGLDVNLAIQGIFLNTTLQAAVHLGQDCEANLRYVEESSFGTVWESYSMKTEKLIGEQTETTGVTHH